MAGEFLSNKGRPELLQEPGFEVAFNYFWQQLSAGMTELWTEDEMAAGKMRARQNEIDFYNHVSDAVDLAASSTDKPVICLFDVDSTLGEIRDDYQSERDFLLRPAVPPLITNLVIRYPERVRFGLLSIRSQQSLDYEVEHPSFTAPVRHFLDPRLVYSSEAESRNDPFMLIDEYKGPEADLIVFLDSLRGVVRLDLLNEVASGARRDFDWYDSKMKMIADFLRFNTSASLVVIDDLPYTTNLDTNSKDGRLVGVCVADQRQMLLP